MDALVARAAQMGASDIHIICGLPPRFRVDGRLIDEGDEPLTAADCARYAEKLVGSRFSLPGGAGELDLATTIAGRRVRVNLFKQQGCWSAAIRLLATEIPKLETLGLPPVVETLTELSRGIVLVTGETGSGKSTTLAAMLDRINHTRREHILTLEDPVEYIYTPDRCAINQREIGRDTASYADGLRAALREDPDVILVGELRDAETMETAMAAAETGHLVFATLHTGSAPDCVDRIVSTFPAERHGQIRMELSVTLRAVLAQQLLPRADRGRVLACEVMMVTPAVRNLIREGKTPQITNALATSAKEGSVTMDNAIIRLTRAGIISRETAFSAASDGEYVRKSLQ